MASSPPHNRQSHSAASPSYQPIAQLPQTGKRRQSDMPSAAPSSKRRKPSILSISSGASHPLRQTSFPPENSQGQSFSRSPSAESVSLVSGVSGRSGTKRKRPRKSKAQPDDEASAVGGTAKSAVSGNSGRGRARASREASADDEDEEGGGETAVTMVARTDEEKRKEKEHKALLLSALDPDQFQRYEAWRASKLADAVVRRVCYSSLLFV
jgi:transcription initiation factor TFIID subunit 11